MGKILRFSWNFKVWVEIKVTFYFSGLKISLKGFRVKIQFPLNFYDNIVLFIASIAHAHDSISGKFFPQISTKFAFLHHFSILFSNKWSSSHWIRFLSRFVKLSLLHCMLKSSFCFRQPIWNEGKSENVCMVDIKARFCQSSLFENSCIIEFFSKFMSFCKLFSTRHQTPRIRPGEFPA